jgi:hypothetical protein
MFQLACKSPTFPVQQFPHPKVFERYVYPRVLKKIRSKSTSPCKTEYEHKQILADVFPLSTPNHNTNWH